MLVDRLGHANQRRECHGRAGRADHHHEFERRSHAGNIGRRGARLGPTVANPPVHSRRMPPRLRRLASALVALVVAIPVLAVARIVSADSVAVELVAFGVGHHARPGDWTGVRVALTSSLSQPTQVEIQWEIENADGDIGEYVRGATLAPGQRLERWLYGRLPPSSNAAEVIGSRPFGLRVFEVADGLRVRELTSTRISGDTARTPAAPVELDQDLFIVLGDRRLGLEVYGLRPTNFPMLPSLSSLGRLASGVQVDDLPDQWTGLFSASAIVWADPGRSPGRLSGDQAESLLEWVRRGGVLVLGIPVESQDIWALGRTGVHPLEGVLPTVAPRRVQGVPVADVLPILTKNRSLLRPDATTSLAVFDPPALDRGWKPFLALPALKASPTGFSLPRRDTLDGRCVGVRRAFGSGQIVLLGVDLDALNGRMLQNHALPQGDVFWNRILGRRGDTPSLEEVAQLMDATPARVVTSFGSVTGMGEGGLISGQIGLTGQAAVGVLAAAGLFAVYWLLSGPLGFAALRQGRLERHAWLLFVVIAFLFTAVAWAGGRLLGSTRPSLRHVTFLDQYAGAAAIGDEFAAPQQRATSWFSVYLPGYGPTRLAVGHGDERRGNLLASWAPPPSGTGDTFPNKDRFRVDLSTPDAYAVPARATSGDFVATWRGTVAPRWGGLISMQTPVELQLDRTVAPNTVRLSGALVHDLPAPLTEVSVILITPYRTPAPSLIPGPLPLPRPETSGELPQYGLAARRAAWNPREPLDLSMVFGDRPVAARGVGASSLSRVLRERYYDPIAATFAPFGGFTAAMNAETRRRYMEMLAFFGMLQPPEWITSPGQTPVIARAQRMLAREGDLSPWFAGPCLIIVGFLEETPCPVPISVEGAAVNGSGMTVFRWICPLDGPADLVVPDIAPPPEAPEATETPDSAASTEELGDEATPLPAPPRPGRRPSGTAPVAVPGRPRNP